MLIAPVMKTKPMLMLLALFALTSCGGDGPDVRTKTGTLVKARFVVKQVSQSASSLLVSDAHAQKVPLESPPLEPLTAYLLGLASSDEDDSAFFITSPDEKIFNVRFRDGTLQDERETLLYASDDCSGQGYLSGVEAMFAGQRVVKLDKHYLVSSYVEEPVTIKSSRNSGGESDGECKAEDFVLSSGYAEVVEYTQALPNFSALAPIRIGIQGL